jgi:ABC-2 type transport system ATP-binding protein
VVDHGLVIAEGTSSELKSSVGVGSLHVRLPDPELREATRRLLADNLGVAVHLGSDPRTLTARLTDKTKAVPALAELQAAGIEIAGFSLGQPSLDEVFFALTGHSAAPLKTDEGRTE